MGLIIKRKNIKRLFEDDENTTANPQQQQNTQQPQQQNTQQQNTQNGGVSTQDALDWAYATFIFQRSVIGFKQGLVQNLQQSGILGRLSSLNQWVNSQFGQLGNDTKDAKSLSDATSEILKSFDAGLKSLDTYKQNISKDANAEKIYEKALTDLIGGKKYDEIQKDAQQQNTQQPQQNTQNTQQPQQNTQNTQQPQQQNTQQQNTQNTQNAQQPQQNTQNTQQQPQQQNESIRLTLNNKLFEDRLYTRFNNI